jgi:hypothetical protein
MEMNRRVGSAFLAAIGFLALFAGQETRAQIAGFDPEALAKRFVGFDVSRNAGKAYSESASSATLAWGESYYLNAYVKMYRVTRYTRWLDKVVDHFDRMVANMSDHDGDGIPGWNTDRYSVSRMRARALHNRGTASIRPEEATVTNIEQAHEAIDAEYIFERIGPDRYVVRNLTGPEVVYDGPYSLGQDIPGIAGFKLRLDRVPEIGDKFRVETWAVRPLEYAVHEGMILYPIAQFIELALQNESLKERYEEKARSYLSLIEEHVLRKQERYWVQMAPGVGAYRFTESSAERFPNRILPHNQYLALGRVFLVLKDVSDHPLFKERANQMASFFKNSLKETGGAYTWAYWDWVEAGRPDQSRTEDTSHGHIDVEFAVEAYRRGVVFTRADMLRFARTLTDQMWNGSLPNPKIGARVDGQDGDATIIRGWIELCRWDPRIWDIYWALFNRLDGPGLEIPHILHTRAVLDGPPELKSSDFNGDRQVDFQDFIAFARNFGSTSDSASFDEKYDLDGNGHVNFADFIAFAGAFGA